MIALLGALLGFGTSAIPAVIGYFKQRQDNKQELAIIDKQIEMQEKQLGLQLQEVSVQANAVAQEALYKTYNTGVAWVDSLNGTVRPVMAYGFLALYAGIKILQIHLIEDVTLDHHLTVIWTDNDTAIFSGIISFYFGQRSFNNNK